MNRLKINQRMIAGIGAGLVVLIGPSISAAHLVTTGMGPVYDGIGHFLLTPEDLVPVIALALYAGLRGAVSGRRAMFLVPLAWFVGGMAGSMTGHTVSFPISAISFLILGGLVAADLYLPNAAVTALAMVLGIAHGFVNGAVLKDGAGMLGLVGIMTILFILITLTSALVVSLKRPWTNIVVRVAGSWIAATGMLMIGWAIR
ncbi:MAG: HupE/UreJ family protein [Desulfosarcina sp.]